MNFLIYFTVLFHLIANCFCVQDLTVLCMIPRYRSSELGTSCVKAANMAVDAINRDTDILPNYRINLELADSKMNDGYASKAFFDSVSRPPTKIAVIGPLISSSSASVASISRFYNMVQMGYAAAGLSLDNKKKYPYYYRTSVTQYSYSLARIALFKPFNWNKVAIIYVGSGTYPQSAVVVQQTLLRANITVAVMESFNDHPEIAIKNIKDKDIRIIIIISHVTHVYTLFCEAYNQGVYGGQYVWLMDGWSSDRWWTRTQRYNVNCTGDQLGKVVINSTFYAKSPVYSTSSQQTIYGKNGTEFYRDFLRKINSTNTYCVVMGQLYDAVWSVALGLNTTEERLKQINSSLLDFSYQNTQIREIFMQELNQLSFYGTTGQIKFYNGSRLGDVEIYQQQDDGAPLIGTYRSAEKKIFYQHPLVWTNGYPPRDHIVVETRILTISNGVFIPFCILASLGICIALAIGGFVIYFRNNKYIKMSSPKLNYCILVGCIMCFISVIVSGVNKNQMALHLRQLTCPAQIWLLSLGFTIAFGSVMVKSWRIYKIFFNSTKVKMVIKDIQLIGRLAQLLAIDIVSLTLWTIIDPIIIVHKQVQSERKVTSGSEIIVEYKTAICQSQNTTIWLAVIFSYKMILLLAGVFLAWKTRKVSIDSLNDSRSLAMTIYNIFVLSCTGVIVGVVSNLILDASFASQSSFVILSTISSMGLIFIPKISQVKISPTFQPSVSKLEQQVRESFQKSAPGKQNLELELRKLKLIIAEQHQKMQILEKTEQSSSQVQMIDL